MNPSEPRCVQCGRPDAGQGIRCPCGASLLVDVVLRKSLDERGCFQLARALAVLGPPVPPFAELREELKREDRRVLRGLSQHFASRVLQVMATQGVTADPRPAALREARRDWAPRVLGGLALVALGMGVIVGGAKALRPPPVLAPVAATPRPSTGELTTQEISRRSLEATVSLKCGDSTGAGFFVEEEQVLTNAHVACPPDQVMEVTLADGRRVLGHTVKRDENLDLALVRVSGAHAPPLPRGDATQLAPGDRLVFIGSPKGMSFTVHEGKVSHLGREYLGLGYVQFDASINPGNSGGPLLNGRGEVVGVVSLKRLDAEGIGLALPIQYASALVSVSGAPETLQRWTTFLLQVAREEERELQQLRLAPLKPILVSMEPDDSAGMWVVLAERFPEPPSGTRHHFTLETDTGSCDVMATVAQWKPMAEAAKGEEDSRRLRWMVSKGAMENVYAGAALLLLNSCPLPGTGSAWLSVDGSRDERSRVRVSVEQLRRAQGAGR